MTDEKICPIMSRPTHQTFVKGEINILYKVPCLKEDCTAWVPEKTFYYACTLDLQDQKHGDCKIHDSIEVPDEPQEATCDGCKYYKQITCKPVPAHCPLVKGGLIR